MEGRIRLPWFSFPDTIIGPVSSGSHRKTEGLLCVLLHDSIAKKQLSRPDTRSLPFVSSLPLSHASPPPVAPSGLLRPADKNSAESHSTCAALGIDRWARGHAHKQRDLPLVQKAFQPCLRRCTHIWRRWCYSIKLYWFRLGLYCHCSNKRLGFCAAASNDHALQYEKELCWDCRISTLVRVIK